jgi:hypothetical protein
LSIPSVRILAQFMAGTRLLMIRTVLVVASTNRSGSSNQYPSHTSA